MGDNCSVYVLYSISECKIRYIGVSLNPDKRLYAHLYEAKKTHTHLRKSRWINKHGDISMKLIYSGSEEDCYKMEIYLIEKYKSKYDLVNLSDGGDRPPKISSLPKDVYDKTIKKISIASKGRKASDETKRKMSESHKSVDKSYLSECNSGVKNPRAFKVDQFDLNGKFIKTWDYAKQASLACGLSKASVTSCISGFQKTAGGYVWKKH